MFGNYSNHYHGFPEIDPTPQSTRDVLGRQPFEVCRQNFIDLSIEQNKVKPDPERIAWLKSEIAKFDTDLQTRAFDSVVDDQGFGNPNKEEAIEGVSITTKDIGYCCEHHADKEYAVVV